jgi:hypothetical protein
MERSKYVLAVTLRMREGEHGPRLLYLQLIKDDPEASQG